MTTGQVYPFFLKIGNRYKLQLKNSTAVTWIYLGIFLKNGAEYREWQSENGAIKSYLVNSLDGPKIFQNNFKKPYF